MADQWYVREGRLIDGPLSWDEVRQAALDGRIRPETLISRSETDGWVAAHYYATLKFSNQSPGTARLRARRKRPRRKSRVAAIVTLLILSAIIAFSTRTELKKDIPPAIARPVPQSAVEQPAADVPPPRVPQPEPSHLRWQRKMQRPP
jgi:hypothetical protein